MMDKILYWLLFAWVKVHALLPLRALYVLSDILYLFVYKIARYRLKVVRANLRGAFPGKSAAELRQLERRFYHNFADYVVETIKLAHISEEEIQRRAYMKNPELLDQLTRERDGCVVGYMGHYGNWEWFASAILSFDHAKLYQIYRPLNNRAFDRLMLYLRSRFGAKGIKKNDTLREMVRLNRAHIPGVVIFIADQTPSRGNIHYWTSFLNRDTPFLAGGERIARKMNLPVVFMDMERVKRGYYAVEIKLISQTPADTPEFWLTEQYARMMEHSILRDPANWLWTHKRWKYQRENE